MTSTPLNEEALEHAIIKYAESSERTDWSELGHFLKEDYRGQVSEIVSAYLSAVPADTVNSVEELDALPQESVIRSVKLGVVRERCASGWLATGADGFDSSEDIAGRDHVVLYRPEVSDA